MPPCRCACTDRRVKGAVVKLASSLARRQDSHSTFLGSAAVLLALTLIVDLLFQQGMVNSTLTWTLLVVCAGASAFIAFRGRATPRWLGIAAVLVFIVAQAYYLSLADHPQSVLSSSQQLPIIAFYLGWFVQPRYAGMLMPACLLVFGVTMWRNPLFAPDGGIGTPVAVHALLAMLFCFGAGLYLWRRQSRVAAIDALTGAYQRREIMDRITRRLQRRSTGRDPFCVVLIDFDDFKDLNDTRGHAAGDEALIETIALIRAGIRVDDSIGRIGGDEFVLLLPHVRVSGAERIVERLSREATHPWSWGIAESRLSDTPGTMLARADLELYAQKQHKRDLARERNGEPGHGSAPGIGRDAGVPSLESRSATTDASRATGRVGSAAGPDPRDASLTVRAVDGGFALARGFFRRQTPFSLISALVPFMLMIVFAVDLIAGHPGIEYGMVRLWFLVYLLLTLVPLVFGRAYSIWAGLVMVIGMEAWSSYFMMFSNHVHAEINALLELPLVALYVAWFYPAAIAWSFMAFSVARVWLSLVANPDIVSEVASPFITLGHATIIMLFCFRGARILRTQLSEQANVDPLTGALNRRGLAEAGARAVRSARRRGESLAVAVIDFDDFKHINDANGHAAGDAALRETVEDWSELVDMRGTSGRAGGLVVRLGGDEFALVARAEAAELDAMLQHASEASPFDWSWGVAPVQAGVELQQTISLADDELYLMRRSR